MHPPPCLLRASIWLIAAVDLSVDVLHDSSGSMPHFDAPATNVIGVLPGFGPIQRRAKGAGVGNQVSPFTKERISILQYAQKTHSK